jgi:Cu/Ag efflux pump CusA
MGMKVYGPDLESIEQAGLALETALKGVPSVKNRPQSFMTVLLVHPMLK